ALAPSSAAASTLPPISRGKVVHDAVAGGVVVSQHSHRQFFATDRPRSHRGRTRLGQAPEHLLAFPAHERAEGPGAKVIAAEVRGELEDLLALACTDRVEGCEECVVSPG